MSRIVSRASLVLCVSIASSSAAAAQSACLDFSPAFGAGIAPDGSVDAQFVFDDGSGPALYIGGSFLTVGATPAKSIARFDGTSWSEVGGGIGGGVLALAVWDDGNGPKLYAGGTFTQAGGVAARRLARWDGTQWSEVGGGVGGASPYDSVSALASYDDGSGSALYVGGSFDLAGGVQHRSLARFDGSRWSDVENGFVADFSQVLSLTVYDDGAPGGARLYVAGRFTIPLFNSMGLAAYDASGWSVPGGSPTAAVFSLVTKTCVYDDGLGGGARLFVCGGATAASGISSSLGAWDGTAWSAPGGGTSGVPTSIATWQRPGGDVLVACGSFTSIGGTSAQHIAQWNGVQWLPLAGGLESLGRSIGVFGGKLFVAGTVPPTTDLRRFDVWDGTSWSPMPGSGTGTDDDVHVLHVHDGSGQALYAGGEFTRAGMSSANRIARWDGEAWTALGAGIGSGLVIAMASFDSGSGPELYVGGLFDAAGGVPAQNIARWNGAAWVPMPGASSDIQAFAVHDDGSGPALYVAGRFTSIGGLAIPGIARWDGTGYFPLLAGLPAGGSFGVYTLARYDDGSGMKLYAGGSFTTAQGPTPADHFVRWNGTSWEALPPSNVQLTAIRDLEVSSVGGATRLFVGGSFTIGGGPLEHFAAWDGSTWSTLGSSPGGVLSDVYDILTHDDGTGSGAALYVTGGFSQIGGVAAAKLARWDGSTWSSVGGGLSGGFVTRGRALAAFDDGHGSGRDLYVGGDFTLAGSVGAARVTRFEGCGETGIPLCFGDGSLAAGCPCMNIGTAGHGCANSQGPEGALLSASGDASADSVVLSASGMFSANTCIFLQGDSLNSLGVVFGDGVRCASGQLLRLAVKSVLAGNAIYPAGGDPSILQRNAALGSPISHPSWRVYQTYYRDANPSFCAAPVGGTFNATNGVKINW